MSKTIILPDHISFEELARIWCVSWENVIKFRYEAYFFSMLKTGFLRSTEFKTLAIFYPLSRSLYYSQVENTMLIHLLRFIKERSDG